MRQARQVALSLVRLTSQPSPGVPLQFANGVTHDPIPHWPLLQTGEACAGAHCWLQPPQLWMSLAVFVSQPYCAVQSAYVPVHATTWHVDASHFVTVFAV